MLNTTCDNVETSSKPPVDILEFDQVAKRLRIKQVQNQLRALTQNRLGKNVRL